MGWQPTYQAEGQAYAKHIPANKPGAKIAILNQNDDFGRDFLKGVMDTLGDKAKTMIVAQATYETSDPTIDSQVVSLKESGADVLINLSTPKFAAQAIKKVAQIEWKPTHYIASVSFSVSSVFQPAGPENAVGIISSTYMRDPSEPRWQSTPEYADYQAVMKKYYSAGNVNDSLNVIGYSSAQTLVQVLKQCGDNLTRENVMKEAANLNMTLPMLSPGIEVKTSPDDFYPIESFS
jgi:ABC-type branched-subunit amino acid transport system substrate-binding protein